MQDARQAGDGRNRRAQRGISRGARPHGTRRQPLGVVLPLGAASAAESGCGGLAPTAALLHLVNLLNLLPGVPARRQPRSRGVGAWPPRRPSCIS